MRILTPAEVRQIQHLANELLLNHINRIVIENWYEGQSIFGMGYDKDDDSREFWLNILDIVLQANESMKLAWRNSPGSNMTSEVLDKLRPNG